MFEIKVIDLNSNNAEKDFYESFKNTGFAVIKNHNVAERTLDDMYKHWSEFFYSNDKHYYKFTEKSLLAIENAHSKALCLKNTELSTLHLLNALVTQEDGLVSRIFEKMKLGSHGPPRRSSRRNKIMNARRLPDYNTFMEKYEGEKKRTQSKKLNHQSTSRPARR